MRRVIQFSTGNVGRHALRTLIARPDLELVGVHANGADKVGRDAAALCGLDQQAETRPQAALDEIVRFLVTGTNVVGTSLVWLVAPHHADEWLRTPLERACKTGNSSLYINGIDPGFSGDTLVYTALSLTARATAVTVQEIFDYGTYDDAEFTGVSMGFGTAPDHTPIMFQPGVLTSLWGGQLRSLADALGVELDEVRERHEPWVTPEQIECTMMTVPPGRVAAVRFAVEGLRSGEPIITMEHVNRLTVAAAPDWPYPPDDRPGVHRVTVAGDPGVEINAHVGLAGVDHNQGGVIATAARAVNVIEPVCRAPSGLLAAQDLPAAPIRGAMWRGAFCSADARGRRPN